MAYQAMARCNKCGSGLAPRSAARAALDLKGAEDLKASAPIAPQDPHFLRCIQAAPNPLKQMIAIPTRLALSGTCP